MNPDRLQNRSATDIFADLQDKIDRRRAGRPEPTITTTDAVERLQERINLRRDGALLEDVNKVAPPLIPGQPK